MYLSADPLSKQTFVYLLDSFWPSGDCCGVFQLVTATASLLGVTKTVLYPHNSSYLCEWPATPIQHHANSNLHPLSVPFNLPF